MRIERQIAKVTTHRERPTYAAGFTLAVARAKLAAQPKAMLKSLPPSTVLAARQGIVHAGKPSRAAARPSDEWTLLKATVADDPEARGIVSDLERLGAQRDGIIAANGFSPQSLQKVQAVEHQIMVKMLGLQSIYGDPSSDLASNLLKILNDTMKKIIQGSG